MLNRKVYVNASGEPKLYSLLPDVKQCLRESQADQGWITVLSAQATTSVVLLESDPDLANGLLSRIQEIVPETEGADKSTRRSGLGPNYCHQRAALLGHSVTIPFERGGLLSHLQQEVFAVDFEPRSGRREFVISVLPAPAAGAKPGGR